MVIIIMSLVTGVVLANFSTSGSRLERQASGLATLIRHMDDLAAARKQTVELKFDFKDHIVSWDAGKSKEYDFLTAVEAPSIGLVHEGEITVIFDPSRTTESMLVHFESDEQKIAVLYNPLGRRVKLLGPQEKE